MKDGDVIRISLNPYATLLLICLQYMYLPLLSNSRAQKWQVATS